MICYRPPVRAGGLFLRILNDPDWLIPPTWYHEPVPDDSQPLSDSEFRSLRGKLLLAEPALRDGIFSRAVILMTQHSRDGASGMILNRPTGKTVGDFLKKPEFDGIRHLPVHDGGPVTHDQLTFSSLWHTPKRGLQWVSRISLDDAIQQTHRPRRMVRAFLGYAGWSAGQLEDELKRNTWFVVSAPAELLGLPHDDTLWSVLMRRLSPLHRILAEAPANPFLN